MNFLNLFLAQEQTAPAAQGGGNMMLIMALFLVGMWILLIAPQRKRQKQHQKMLNELKTGDEVITIGGIYGTITNVKEKTFILKVDDSVKIEILRSAVQASQNEAIAPAKK